MSKSEIARILWSCENMLRDLISARNPQAEDIKDLWEAVKGINSARKALHQKGEPKA